MYALQAKTQTGWQNVNTYSSLDTAIALARYEHNKSNGRYRVVVLKTNKVIFPLEKGEKS